jgi:hypothetical protein
MTPRTQTVVAATRTLRNGTRRAPVRRRTNARRDLAAVTRLLRSWNQPTRS